MFFGQELREGHKLFVPAPREQIDETSILPLQLEPLQQRGIVLVEEISRTWSEEIVS